MTSRDLSKQQALDTDPRAIHQINFNADYIVKEVQEWFLFLKKWKKLFWTLQKEL